MITNTIENTIVNYLNNQATVTEMEVLEAWLADKNNEKLFLEYVKLNFLIDINTKSFDRGVNLSTYFYLLISNMLAIHHSIN
jgi:hypothetical protein